VRKTEWRSEVAEFRGEKERRSRELKISPTTKEKRDMSLGGGRIRFLGLTGSVHSKRSMATRQETGYMGGAEKDLFVGKELPSSGEGAGKV